MIKEFLNKQKAFFEETREKKRKLERNYEEHRLKIDSNIKEHKKARKRLLKGD